MQSKRAPTSTMGGETQLSEVSWTHMMMADASSCFAAVKVGRRPTLSFLSFSRLLRWTWWTGCIIRSFHQNCCRWFSRSTSLVQEANSSLCWKLAVCDNQSPRRQASVKVFNQSWGCNPVSKRIIFGKASLRRRLMLCKPWWDLVRKLQYGRVKGKRRLFRFS